MIDVPTNTSRTSGSAVAQASDDVLDPVIEAYKKDVDRTLICHNLRLTVEERFENLMEMQRFAEEMRAGMLRATGKK